MTGLHAFVGFCLSPFGIWLPVSFVAGAVLLSIDYHRYEKRKRR